MNIKGILKTSLIDYPGKICSVLFTGGCNLRCCYCHNPELAKDSKSLQIYKEEDVLCFLKKRRGLIDGVVLTGGEPTLQNKIDTFIESVKKIPLSIKVDTNGLRPEVIERLLSKNLIDYIAIDVKTSPEKYELVTSKRVDFSKIKATIQIVKESGLDFELRTTCVPDLVTIDDFKIIKREIGSVNKYYLQQFTNRKTLDSSLQEYKPYPSSIIYEFKRIVHSFAQICEIRGI
ncbi:MAG: anaerobic ribonucleoside-triphosphate reductase activating protein [Spirochaetota bacterium]|nr:anaerobic ribonucleoside-triphosphate reductase activating protein [Spirochaetota bacterium]